MLNVIRGDKMINVLSNQIYKRLCNIFIITLNNYIMVGRYLLTDDAYKCFELNIINPNNLMWYSVLIWNSRKVDPETSILM